MRMFRSHEAKRRDTYIKLLQTFWRELSFQEQEEFRHKYFGIYLTIMSLIDWNQMTEQSIDAAHIARQREWSERTFGPGARIEGLIAHIRKELEEIEADQTDTVEWVDVAILAIDGAWRSGAEPDEIIDIWKRKQTRNELRSWPAWDSVPVGQPIEHVRGIHD